MARPSLLRPFEDLSARHGTLAKISAAIEDEGFRSQPGPDGPPDTRRGQFYDYTRACDLADRVVEARLLRVLETILTWVPEVEAIYPSN